MRNFNPLHFVDPTTFSKSLGDSKSSEPARPVMITGTKRGFEVQGREGDRVGEITYLHDSFKNKSPNDSLIGWLVDTDRNHVAGVLGYRTGNALEGRAGMANYFIYQIDGAWALGAVRSHHEVQANYRPFLGSINTPSSERYMTGDDARPQWTFSRIAMSNGDPVYAERVDVPEMIFPAADWAYRMFPRHGYTDEMRDKMLELAEAHYKEAFAFLGLQIQSHRRAWGDAPRRAVMENGVDIPEPSYAVTLTGDASLSATLNNDQRRALESAGISPASVIERVPYTITLPSRDNYENVTEQHSQVSIEIRAQFPERTLHGINNSQSTKVISGLKSN